MTKTVFHDGDEGVLLIVKDKKTRREPAISTRTPVHVVYGGADRFSAGTPAKLGKLALASLETYAPSAGDFAAIFEIDDLKIAKAVYTRTLQKLKAEPVEDFRIDFEDGYGFRPDDEEDADAVKAAGELAATVSNDTVTAGSGFRIKSLAPETFGRAMRTLDLFLTEFLEKTGGRIPDNFVVTLPKVSDRKEVKQLAAALKQIEKKYKLAENSVGIEIVVETPQAIFDKKGRLALPGIVKAAKGRLRSAHFGAYDLTSSLGIAGEFQDIRHPACNFARQIMQFALVPLNIPIADSVTTEMPIPAHRGGRLTKQQKQENLDAVRSGWRTHYQNVSASIADGFYQSWDLHPNQLVARYAAVYAFYLRSKESQAARLKSFIDRATKANLTGSTFDDAASAQGLLGFFRRAADSGAVTTAELKKLTGLTPGELKMSFMQLMQKRRS